MLYKWLRKSVSRRHRKNKPNQSQFQTPHVLSRTIKPITHYDSHLKKILRSGADLLILGGRSLLIGGADQQALVLCEKVGTGL
jgi:hypothetical protein